MEMAVRRREQEVWQACDDLWAFYGELKSLTGDAIRERLVELGKSRGSPNEIYKYRKTWEESRKVNGLGQAKVGEAFSDPISRAVKLVHEKLQTETEETIAKIKEEFLIELRAKEEELLSLKNNLDALVNQYKQLDDLCSEQESKIKELQNNLNYQKNENIVQENSYRESKSIFEQKIISLVEENKSLTLNHQKEIDALKKIFDEQISLLSNHLNASQEKIVQEGKIFSEQLMEIKTKNYNLSIKLDESIKSNISAEKSLEQIAVQLKIKDESLTKKIQENIELKAILSKTRVDNYRLNNELKSALTSLARMRCAR